MKLSADDRRIIAAARPRKNDCIYDAVCRVCDALNGNYGSHLCESAQMRELVDLINKLAPKRRRQLGKTRKHAT